MSYTINFTSSSKGTLTVGTDNIFTGLLSVSLIGKRTPNWGEPIQENLIHIMENFDNTTAPVFPTTGQLWSDTSSMGVSRMLKLYDGSSWKQVALINTSGSLPVTGQYVGQLWTYNNNLYFWNGSNWKQTEYERLALSGGTLTGNVSLTPTPTNPQHLVTKQYVDNAISTSSVLLASGGVVAGHITIITPTTDYHAATKLYVDGAISTSASAVSGAKVSKSGDTMTGFLTLNANPANPLHAATKSYVDDAIVTAGSGLAFVPVNRAGDTMTGFLTLSADPTNLLHAASKQYVDNAPYLKLIGGTVTGATIFSNTVSFSGATTFTAIPSSNVTPTTALHVTNKQYVDDNFLRLIGGALTGNVTLSVTPINNNHIITKAFADANFLSLVGGTVTGNITLGSGSTISCPTAPITVDHLANKSYVDTTTVSLFGDTMTGFLTLSADPTNVLHAVTKQYVDNAVISGGGAFVLTTGSTMTGNLFVPATISPSATQVVTYDYIKSNFVSSSPVTNNTPIQEELKYTTVFSNTMSIGSIATEAMISKKLLLDVLDGYVQVAGDTMTGILTLSADPVGNFDAATKQYVDTTTVSLAGDTMTGFLTLSADPTNLLHAATKQYVDTTTVSLAGDTMTGFLTLSADPTNVLHAASKQYVDTTTVSLAGDTMTGDLILGSGVKISSPFVAVANFDVPNKLYVDDNFVSLAGDTMTGDLILGSGVKISSPFVAVANFDVPNKLYVDDNFVSLAGDTMTGFLTLSADPTNVLHAASKQYVDTTTVSLAGDTMTGFLTLSADPTNVLHAASKQYVDTTTVSLAGDTMTGFLTLSADPTNTLHAVSKHYVDDPLLFLKRTTNLGFYDTDYFNGLIGTIYEGILGITGTVTRSDTVFSDADGVLSLATGTSSSGYAEITSGGNGTMSPTNSIMFLSRIRFPTASTSGERYVAGAGMMGGPLFSDNSFVHSFHLVYQQSISPNWIVRQRLSGSDLVNITTSTAVAINSWIYVKVIYDFDNSLLSYYVNGTMIHQETGVSLTGSYYASKAFITKTNGITTREMLIDRTIFGKVHTTESNWEL